MLNLTQYWLSYGLEKVQNLNLENTQNESVFVKFFCCSWLFFSPLNQKNVFKNYLTRFLRFLAFQNCPWSSECAKNHGSDSKFKFLFQNKGLQISDLEIFSREDLEGKIHFEYFPSLSFGPSQGHNSVNTGSNSTSRTIFEN